MLGNKKIGKILLLTVIFSVIALFAQRTPVLACCGGDCGHGVCEGADCGGQPPHEGTCNDYGGGGNGDACQGVNCPNNQCCSGGSCGQCISCFPAGTKVTMSDRSYKNIEDIKVGEKVLGYDDSRETYLINTVTGLEHPIRDNMCTINFRDGDKLQLTSEHPMYTKAGWKSIIPELTAKENSSLPVTALVRGDKLFKDDDSWQEIKSIACRNGVFQTYNLVLK